MISILPCMVAFLLQRKKGSKGRTWRLVVLGDHEFPFLEIKLEDAGLVSAAHKTL